MERNAPIGIFDSGMGGLTVANAVKQALPKERIIYFGDSAHLPYGDKSAATIQAYSVKICDVLLQQGCKVILIACNSASAAAYDLVKAYVSSRAKVLNVIDPVVDSISIKPETANVGLIGTRQTIESGVYKAKLQVKSPETNLVSVATPLLAPMIEEGFYKNELSEQIIRNYLQTPDFDDIEALILGCTHYPLIKEQVTDYFERSVEVIDSSELVAAALKQMLKTNDLLSKGTWESDRFLVSDYTPSFHKAAGLFFGSQISLEKHVLWE